MLDAPAAIRQQHQIRTKALQQITQTAHRHGEQRWWRSRAFKRSNGCHYGEPTHLARGCCWNAGVALNKMLESTGTKRVCSCVFFLTLLPAPRNIPKGLRDGF